MKSAQRAQEEDLARAETLIAAACCIVLKWLGEERAISLLEQVVERQYVNAVIGYAWHQSKEAVKH